MRKLYMYKSERIKKAKGLMVDNKWKRHMLIILKLDTLYLLLFIYYIFFIKRLLI